jgi:ppGpp synthetase/RelA/SpoT-type nucleotidyltranferase
MSELPEISNEEIENLIALYEQEYHNIETFMSGTGNWLGNHPDLRAHIHSFKSRVKDKDHLREKIRRKASDGKIISRENFFQTITDLGGVRILHLFQSDFKKIHSVITERVREEEWHLHENPVANTWDPEAEKFFESLGLEVRIRDTFYTSVHYVIKPQRKSDKVFCEIQVRTLFEEIWGEVDHMINYPHSTDNVALKEQLMVLSKITGAGIRLLESIDRVRPTAKREN